MGTTEFKGVRISVETAQPFDTVIDRLYSSIGKDPGFMSRISFDNKDAFSQSVQAATGPHDFMFFAEFDHGAWVSLFNVGGGLKAKRVILGNPLIAITMLKHDMKAGLFVPIEILVTENEDQKSACITYNLPSAEITGINNNPRLLEAAQVLDGKLRSLVQDIAG